MPITTVKNSIAFPEIGQIRKGGVKSEKMPGRDLNEKFRVLFFPGNEESQQKFTNVYGGLFPTKIKAMLPFPRLDECWVVYNEAYSAGRMLARADGEKYITLRDGKTGDYEISNGEPFRAFTPGDVVSYTDPKGKLQRIKLKPVGRLYLFLPDLERAVFLTLKTTSYYDAINIDRQLGAVQAMANSLNHGVVAGIQIQIYRRPQSITWNKEDGTAVRIDKWLINIEVDPDWMRNAIERLSKFALTGGATVPALTSGITGEADPNDEGEDVPDGVTEGEFEDAPNPEPEPAPAKNGSGKTDFDVKAYITEKAKSCEVATSKASQQVAATLEGMLGNTASRYEFMSYLAGKGVKTSKDIDQRMITALYEWLDPKYDSLAGRFYTENDEAKLHITHAHQEFLKSIGQMDLL